MKKTNVEPSLFFLNFQGEFISILLETKMSTVSQTDDQIESADVPLSVQGFMIDEDEQYYYLGKLPQAIDRAVPKSRILYVELVQPENPYDTILEGMGNPENNEVN